MNFAFPAASTLRPTPPARHVNRPCPRADANVPTEAGPAVGGATAEETNGQARRGGKSQRTCAEDTKYREARRKEAHLPQELGEKTRFVRRLRSYESGRGREERQPTLPAQCWTLCHCVLRHQTPVLNAQTGEFETFLLLRLKDHRSDWAAFLGEAFPCISSLLCTFPFPSRCSYCLPCLPIPPLNSHIPKD